MQLFLCRRTVISAWLVALAVMLAAPAAGATALPEKPIKKTGFRLLARASGSLKVNQVQCGLISNGQICVDSTGSSTIPGSVWPKGTNNQYTFNSGISLAGIVGSEMPQWAGDTIGAFFFEGSGFLLNGEQVEPIYNASDAADVAQWPDFARVPGAGDSVATIYDPLLQNQVSASQGDVYFLTWDGNPARVNGRIHPMGVVVETRGLAWNYPAGNQDIIYFIYTLYNVSSVAPEDYINIREPLKQRLLQQATQFQASNEAAFGVDIPQHGYTLTDVFMNFGADQDVTVNSGADYATFNNLFNLAITYEEKFEPQPGNVFDPGIHAPPFLPGPGFVGTKYLRSPILENGEESGTVLAGLTTNRGAFPDPNNAQQLYRYISGNLNPAAGDPQCNTGDPRVTHLCFINNVPSDTRTFQSSGPLNLPAGGQATIVVAYIFAPPVATGKCPSIPCPVTMTPNPLLIANATVDNPGVDAIDSAMGYRGYTSEVSQDSTRTVPNSLLDKAKVAQNIFNSKFLLPFAPTAPEFFLVPGDNQVTVLWRPSTSETQGDAYFAIANDPNSGARYDPAYRQFDVEGYRIYRGRVDTPSELELVAQFDYDTTQMFDFQGTINPNETCGPELGITAGCAGPFPTTPPVPPARFTDSVAVNLNGPIVQVRPGQRVALTNGTVRVNNGPNAVDSLVTGGNTGFPELANTGVPFAYTDDGTGLLSAPRNNVRYFYAVTAFDVNSFVSGPASLESQRAARAVVPVHQASNVQTAALASTITGDDDQPLDPATPTFTIDPETGRFNGPPPPTGAAQLEAAFAPLIPTLLPTLSLTATIDSVIPRSVECPAALQNFRGFCAEFFVTFDRSGQLQKFRTLVAWPFWVSATATGETSQTGTGQLGALPVQPDPASAARYGIPNGAASFNAAVQVTTFENIRSSAQENQQARRLLANVSPGGSRWFSGANETVNDPTYSIRLGHVDGVDSIWAPLSHTDQNPVLVGVQEPAAEDACMQLPPHFLAPMARQADIELTWGDAGTVASVRDITNHLDVPFHAVPQAGWGFVTDNNGNGKIDWADFMFTPGVFQAVKTFAGAPGFCPGLDALAGPINPLVQTAAVTPVSFTADAGGAEAPANFATSGNGFGLYINGQQFIFALTGGALPAAGTKWTLRMYWGVVTASTNAATTDPSGYAYAASPGGPAMPGLKINFSVTQATNIAAATKQGLEAVHTVPDPYYVTNSFETTTTDKIIRFVNLPARAIIRIYSSSGVLVRVLEHNSERRGARDEDVSVLGGQETWDVRNRNNQVVASGVYFYHIESGSARRVGRFTVVNFAQ